MWKWWEVVKDIQLVFGGIWQKKSRNTVLGRIWSNCVHNFREKKSERICVFLLPGFLFSPQNERKEHPTNPAYLASSLTYSEDRLVEDEAKLAVMMEWERPLMARHANFIAGDAPVGSVLNVGFGMGIVDTALQSHRPAQHTIIEAHPQVLFLFLVYLELASLLALSFPLALIGTRTWEPQLLWLVRYQLSYRITPSGLEATLSLYFFFLGLLFSWTRVCVSETPL